MMKPETPDRPLRLTTPRLELRLPTAQDAEALADYTTRNRAQLASTSPPRETSYYTSAYWRQIAPQIAEEFQTDRTVRLIFFKHADRGRVVGMANFGNIVRGPFQACYLGYELDSREQGQGLMSEALQSAIAYVFTQKNLHRIMANHLPENLASQRVLQKLGFQPEGLAHQYLFIAGAWRDHVLNSLTNPAWQPPSPDYDS